MVEQPRRHGHYDPRLRAGAAVGRSPTLTLVPDAPWPAEVGDDFDLEAPQRLVLAGTGGRDDAPLGAWESEGGRFASEPELGGLGAGQPLAGLDWYEFLAARFPGRRRHDREAMKAYESYRSSADPGPPFTLG